jgi:hypothetical protein
MLSKLMWAVLRKKWKKSRMSIGVQEAVTANLKR